MKSRYDGIELLPDILDVDQEKYEKLKISMYKMAITAMAASCLFTGVAKYRIDNNYTKVDRQDLEQIDKNLDQPYIGETLKFSDQDASLDIHIDKSTDEHLNRVAKECGLTLASPEIYLQELQTAKDYNQALASLNGYVSAFGFQFNTISELDDIDKQNSLYERAILDEQYIKDFVNLNTFKQTATSIMQALRYTPVEYLKVSNIKEVRFLKGFGKDRSSNIIGTYSGRDSAASAIAMQKDNIVYFAISAFSPYKGPNIFFHEIGHLIDGQQMGNMQQKDPEYTALNPKDFEYFDEKSFLEHKDAVVSEYGSINIVEDKATVSAEGPQLAYSESPIIRDKSRLLIARLEEDIPNISRYYAVLCTILNQKKAIDKN